MSNRVEAVYGPTGRNMTFEIGFLLAIIATMIYFFLTEKLPVELTAFAGLATLALTGYVQPDEAFLGFSSPAVITMLSVFFISGALLHTGVADAAARAIYRLVGPREMLLIACLMLVAGVLSAFMNNVAATAVMMPAVASFPDIRLPAPGCVPPMIVGPAFWSTWIPAVPLPGPRPLPRASRPSRVVPI